MTNKSFSLWLWPGEWYDTGTIRVGPGASGSPTSRRQRACPSRPRNQPPGTPRCPISWTRTCRPRFNLRTIQGGIPDQFGNKTSTLSWDIMTRGSAYHEIRSVQRRTLISSRWTLEVTSFSFLKCFISGGRKLILCNLKASDPVGEGSTFKILNTTSNNICRSSVWPAVLWKEGWSNLSLTSWGHQAWPDVSTDRYLPALWPTWLKSKGHRPSHGPGNCSHLGCLSYKYLIVNISKTNQTKTLGWELIQTIYTILGKWTRPLGSKWIQECDDDLQNNPIYSDRF